MAIPEITKRQMEFMKTTKPEEEVETNGLKIRIQPYMFPPASPYSYSTRILLDSMKKSNERILEIGTGCGILSVCAAKLGAKVDGVDILPECIQYSRNNAIKNGVSERTRFFHSDMFSDVTGKYDTIICNLPILEGNLPDNNPAWYSLFDPEFKFHKELFARGKEFGERIILAHADILGEQDFTKLEQLAASYGWKPTVTLEKEFSGQRWRRYEFK